GNTNFHNDGIIPPPLVENFAFCPPPLRRGLGGGYLVILKRKRSISKNLFVIESVATQRVAIYLFSFCQKFVFGILQR
ncbi:hypothetical protein, partial [Helicobacter sp. T3_23-1056]